MPTLNQIRSTWDEFYESRQEREVFFREEEAKARIFGRYGLGLGARLAILCHICFDTQSAFADALVKLSHPSVGLKKKDIYDALAPNDGAKIPVGTYIKDEIVELAVEYFAVSKNRPEIGLGDFRCKKFDGLNAVDDFLAWLTGEDKQTRRVDVDHLGSALASKFHLPTESDGAADPSRGRQQLLEDLDAFLIQESATPKLIKVVYGEGLAEGLRALAKVVVDRREGDDRDLVFLPVSRYPRNPAAPERQHGKISFETLVGNLDAFCTTGRARCDHPPDTLGKVREAIERIRKRMAVRPMILIFEGWTGGDPALAALNNFILDDGLAELLSEIINPWMGQEVGEVDPDTFYRNRIVLLSERSFSALKEFQAAPLLLTVPPPSGMGEIIIGQSRKNRSLLESLSNQATLRLDAVQTLLDDLLYLHGARPEHERPDFDPTGLDRSTAIRAWIDALDQFDLMILRFVALSRDGLRVSTLLRLLRDWSIAVAADPKVPAMWQLPRPLTTFDSLEKKLQSLASRRLIVIGRDVPIHGLDNPAIANTMAFSGDFPTDPLGPRLVDFPNVMQRTELLKDLFSRCAEAGNEGVSVRNLVARLHHLVAESSLAQHTMVARYTHWTENADAHHFRCLVQAIFHGFASLIAGRTNADGDEASDDALGSTAPVIPVNFGQAYDRLYNDFYRSLIESPPNWFLARLLGREDLRYEILLTAMNSDQTSGGPWNQIYGFRPRLSARRSSFLERRPKNDLSVGSSRAEIWLDQLSAMAKAAYHLGYLPEANAAAKLYQTELSLAPAQPTPDDPLFGRRVDLSKIQADIAIAEAEPGEGLTAARGQVEDLLVDLGFARSRLDEISSRVKPPNTQGKGDGWPAEMPLTRLVETWAAGCSADCLAAWSDLLCRYAETQALEAVQEDSASHYVSELMEPFAVLFVAERFRQIAFERAPLRRVFYVNGHSARVFIRTILQLVQAIDQAPDGAKAPPSLPSRSYLVQLARRHIDLLTRFLANLPTERASLLILEAQFARRTQSGSAEALEAAEYCLFEAERMLSATSNRPRVRLRFTAERCKVYIARLELTLGAKPSAHRSNLHRAVRYEVERLELLSASAPKQWHAEAFRIRNRLKNVEMRRSTAHSR